MNTSDEKRPLLPATRESRKQTQNGSFSLLQTWPRNYFKRKQKSLVCVVITVLILASVGTVISLAVKAGVVVEDEKFELTDEQVGGKVPVKIESSDFDSHKVARIKIRLSNTTTSGVSIYYGPYDCDDLGKNVTILKDKTSFVNLTSSSPHEINYYNDTPLYVLSGTNLVYNISASTNSLEDGCISLYLFNTSNSYQNFLGGFDFTYYYKSDCGVKFDYDHSTVVTSLTINLNETMFLFGGVIANITAIANITISGRRYEYDVSSLKSLTVYTSGEIHFCHHSLCLGLGGEKHCILVKSNILATISYLNEKVDIEVSILAKQLAPYGIACIGIIAFVILVLALVICSYKLISTHIQAKNTTFKRDENANNQPDQGNQSINAPHLPEQEQQQVPPVADSGHDSVLKSGEIDDQQILDSHSSSSTAENTKNVSSNSSKVTTPISQQDTRTRLPTDKTDSTVTCYGTNGLQETMDQNQEQQFVPGATGNRDLAKIIKKTPDQKDVYDQLKNSGRKCREIINELRLSERNQMEVMKEESEDVKLELALKKWREEQPVDSDCTWETVLNVLETIGRKDLAKKVQTFLKKPEVFLKYEQREDFVAYTSSTLSV